MQIISYLDKKNLLDQDSVAESVIQASGMVLFEDVLKTGTLVVDIWSAVVNYLIFQSRLCMLFCKKRYNVWNLSDIFNVTHLFLFYMLMCRVMSRRHWIIFLVGCNTSTTLNFLIPKYFLIWPTAPGNDMIYASILYCV